MIRRLPLSVLAHLIQDTLDTVFYDQSFWIVAEVTDLKKYESKGWCFLKFIEKQGEQMMAEMAGVFWKQTYDSIRHFEATTGRQLANGLQISCRVMVKYHVRYGLKLEVQEIDSQFTLGQMALSKQRTLNQLVQNFPGQVVEVDGEYITANKRLRLPKVMQRVALIAAAQSDGYRDFMQEVQHNAPGYHFEVSHFPASVQGQFAALQIGDQLDQIRQQVNKFDVVVLVRGGGSQTDLQVFDDYELARRIAVFPIPVLTGIGHDSNTSIADMMGWAFKTPTKVGAELVAASYAFDQELQGMRQRIDEHWQHQLAQITLGLQQSLQKIQSALPHRIAHKKATLVIWNKLVQHQWLYAAQRHSQQLLQWKWWLEQYAQGQVADTFTKLKYIERMVAQASPETILQRGFAYLTQQETIITSVHQVKTQLVLVAHVRDGQITTHIENIEPNP